MVCSRSPWIRTRCVLEAFIDIVLEKILKFFPSFTYDYVHWHSRDYSVELIALLSNVYSFQITMISSSILWILEPSERSFQMEHM